MNHRYIFNTISLILKYISVLMLVPCICAVWFKEWHAYQPFIISCVVSMLLSRFFKDCDGSSDLNNIKRGETLAIVLFSWVIFSLIGSIPYLYFGMTPINALFESVSGVTTTGATIMTDFTIYPKTLFFWRSFSQWLGGMGILVLFIAILPQFAIAGRQMFFAESPGASSTESKLTPRIRQTAAALWSIYFLLTFAEVIILTYLGMPLYDSICNSFSTVANGGFSPAYDSIMQYGEPKYFWTIMLFMFLAGTNFALQYKIYVKRNFLSLFKDYEFRLYFFVVLIFSIIIAVVLVTLNGYNIEKAIESALFQVISIITTTGFYTVDYNDWNLRAKLILFILMFCGASIGSASGGLKLLRLIFIFKYLKRQVSKIFHPNGVYPVKINRVIINEDVVRQMISFVIFYYTIFAVTAVILTYIEENTIIGISSAIATLGNVGPGFGAIGPAGNFSSLQNISKIICILNMLIGRLELIPFLALLHPDFWNFKKIKNLPKNKQI